ncbi:hypothetical protein C8R44DRAFT_980697 [Mycena epipterygia]|nr:hypothetical protein C8R44DRAFT_980697 [Mycena epipterygia]
MANFTAALLGSFSRIFFPPPVFDAGLGIFTSQSDPEISAVESTQRRPASSASMRPRPSSAIEGYWSWDGPNKGMILRQRAPQQDLGLKGLADVQITQSAPVLACQPPRACTPSPVDDGCASSTPDKVDAAADSALEDAYSTAPTPDSSFDISLISDTSTSEDSESDTSFTLPPLPAIMGLGISGLFKADGSPFDGMGVVSFGCTDQRRPRRDEGGLSRTFLEEAAWTWAADPHHRMLSVIQEGEEEPEQVVELWARTEQDSSSAKHEVDVKGRTRTRTWTRDLSTVNTISSELKRQIPHAKARSTTPAPRSASIASGPRSASVAPGVRRATPAWRG